MNNVFSITRFAKLGKNEIISNYKNYLTFGGIVLIPFLINIMFKWFSPFFSIHLPFYGFFGGVLCVIIPFVLYKNLFHKVRGVSYSMIPASNNEKFFSLWIQSVILTPLFVFTVLFLCISIINLIYGQDFQNIFKYLFIESKGTTFFVSINSVGFPALNGFFNTPFWSIISYQALAVWGICIFRTGKVKKTILSFVIFGFVMAIIMWIVISSLNASTEEILNFAMNNKAWLLFNKIIGILFPFVLWGWAYYKFPRQQV